MKWRNEKMKAKSPSNGPFLNPSSPSPLPCPPRPRNQNFTEDYCPFFDVFFLGVWRLLGRLKKDKEIEKMKENEKFKKCEIYDFHDFVSECVSFPEENQQHILGVTVFPRKSDKFHWTKNKNTHVTDENERKKIAKVSPSNNNYSFGIIEPFNNNTQ